MTDVCVPVFVCACVHGACHLQEELLIFMEYCSDGTVHDLAKQGPPESLVRVLVHQLLQAVQILHDNCIVHGDIKGANIFLTPTGGVKLGDFGSSVKLADVAGTAHGEVLGMRGTVGKLFWTCTRIHCVYSITLASHTVH